MKYSRYKVSKLLKKWRKHTKWVMKERRRQTAHEKQRGK